MFPAIQRSTQKVFVWVALIPILLSILTYFSVTEFKSRVDWVSHTREVIDAIEAVQLSVAGAETLQRNYLLTFDEAFVRRMELSIQKVQSNLERLSNLVADNPVQRSRVVNLRELALRKCEYLRRVAATRRTESLDAAIQLMKTLHGPELTDTIQSRTEEMRRSEELLLQERLTDQRWKEAELVVLFASGIIGTLLLLAWSWRSIGHYATARDQAAAEVLKLNEVLEARVAERTLELQRANDELRRSNEDLSRFTYIASHDLQEPLRMVTSYVQLLERRYAQALDDNARQYIGYAVEGAVRMQRLIHDVLEYSRLGGDQDRGTVDMNSVFSTTVRNLELVIAETSAKISSGDLPAVHGDEAALVAVLQNLFANSLKFRHSERAPVISVTAEASKGMWKFRIADNGIGFDSRYADKIFGMFQRLHTRRDYEGTGIGLAVCKRRIEALGGQIWAESKPGEGSTFYFSLPAAGE